MSDYEPATGTEEAADHPAPPTGAAAELVFAPDAKPVEVGIAVSSTAVITEDGVKLTGQAVLTEVPEGD